VQKPMTHHARPCGYGGHRTAFIKKGPVLAAVIACASLAPAYGTRTGAGSSHGDTIKEEHLY